MTDQRKAYLYALATVLMWSTVASAFKVTLRYLDYAQLLLYSSIVSILILGTILIVQGKIKQIFALDTRQYLLCLCLGFLNPFVYYLILFKAYDLLPAQVAQPINYTWALMLAFLSIPLLKQSIGKKDIIAGIVCYLGVLIISTRGNLTGFRFADPLGVALALVSTVIWALYWVYNTRDGKDPVVGLFLNFTFALPFVVVYCTIFSELRIHNLAGFIGAIYVGTFEMGITFVLWLTALKLSENTAKVGNLIFLSPFVSLIFIHFVVGEDIFLSTFTGLFLIVAGLLYQRLRSTTFS